MTELLLWPDTVSGPTCDVIFRRQSFECESNCRKPLLLDSYYANLQDTSFMFQILSFLIIARQLQQAPVSDLEACVIECERPFLSGTHAYIAHIDPCLNRVEHAVYDLFLQKEGVRHILPSHIVFLDSEECLGRRSRKNMKGNEINTLENLEKCRHRLKALVGKSNSEPYHESQDV